jgi:hypothetical protein
MHHTKSPHNNSSNQATTMTALINTVLMYQGFLQHNQSNQQNFSHNY